MSERQPYEDELHSRLNDLPLPDMEQSWQHMKRLLEEEDDDRPVPPIFLRSCLGWGLLLLAALGGAWLLLRPERWWRKEHPAPASAAASPHMQNTITADTTKYEIKNINNNLNKQNDPRSPAGTETAAAPAGINAQSTTANSTAPVNTAASSSTGVDGSSVGYKKAQISGTKPATGRSAMHATNQYEQHLRRSASKANASVNITGAGSRKAHRPDRPSQTASDITKSSTASSETNSSADATQPSKAATVAPRTADPAKPSDTTHQKITAIKQKDSALAAKPNTPVAQQKKAASYYWSAGIALQQQIPLAGQKIIPYNYYGRKASLGDYIPSVYLRFHRDERWFIQGEFRYGAPQSVREHVYSQVSEHDSGSSVVNTTTLRLRKTFYHQFPFSFNYYVLPGWSVGAGIMYDRFYGAVVQRELSTRNSATQPDTVIRKELVAVPASTDSFFKKSDLQLLLQTEYSWRRFSIGMRYTRGIEPFIEYNDAAGILRREKNQSLQGYIRFRIWRSGR